MLYYIHSHGNRHNVTNTGLKLHPDGKKNKERKSSLAERIRALIWTKTPEAGSRNAEETTKKLYFLSKNWLFLKGKHCSSKAEIDLLDTNPMRK